MKKLNNKGFTLVELLAVVAILVIIMMIALPNISSAIERTKTKQNKAVEKVIVTAGNLYVSDHKNSIMNESSSNYCFNVATLVSNDYLDEEDVGDYENYSLKYTKNSETNKIEFDSMQDYQCAEETVNEWLK